MFANTLLGITVLCGSPAGVHACECYCAKRTIEEQIASAAAIVVARVMDRKQIVHLVPGGEERYLEDIKAPAKIIIDGCHPERLTLTVTEVLKGSPPSLLTVRRGVVGTQCDVQYKLGVGTNAVFFLDHDTESDAWFLNGCAPSEPVHGDAPSPLAQRLRGILASPASAAPAAGTPAAETSVSIAEFGLVFDAPGRWLKQKSDDPTLAVYRAPGEREQITISHFPLKDTKSPEDRRDTVARMVDHRQDAERRNMNGKVSFGSVKSVERDGLAISTYCGLDQEYGRPFATVVLAAEDSAWVLFHEATERASPSLCSRAEGMCASIRRAGTRPSGGS